MNTDKSPFFIALMQELLRNMPNWYGADNWDHVRYGEYKGTLKSSLVNKFNQVFSKRIAVVPNYTDDLLENLSKMKVSIEGLSWLYDLLADEYSKSTLVKVMAYRIMGHKKVKLPLNTDSYWSQRAATRDLVKNGETLKIKFNDLRLKHLDLNKLGYPIEAFLVPAGAVDMFVLKQYEYRKKTPEIKAQNGDYVIDGGGCWGDTALYFAHMVGEQGRVFTFEFVPENLGVLRQNLELNPPLMERIEIVENPLWDRTGETMTYSFNGPGTSLYYTQDDALQASTLSIDDFVRDKKLPRVDFIKMDIEGAELNALRGGEETIRAFRPTLAISAYHKEDDLITIPEYLNKLDVGYEFFLDHFTIHREETVLFASPKTE